MNIIGKKVKRIDGIQKAEGTAKYASDYYFHNMLYASVVYANVPHGILKSIDTSKAYELPGVVYVATYKDVPGINKFGHVVKDMNFLVPVGGKIRFEGDVIALIAAETKEIADMAAKLVSFEIEELPPVLTIDEAIKDEVIVNGTSNIGFHRKIRRGDVEKAFMEVEDSGEAIDTAAKAVEQAGQNLERAKGRYEVGVGSPVEVTDATENYISATNSYYTTLYDYWLALAALEKATGGIIE